MKARTILLLLSLITFVGCNEEENEPIEFIDYTGTYEGEFQHENGNPNDFPYRNFKIYVLDEFTLNMEVKEYIFNSDSSDYMTIRYYFKDNTFLPDGSFEVELFDLTFVNGVIKDTTLSGDYFVMNGSSGTISGNKIKVEHK